jgi:hypothetical protein
MPAMREVYVLGNSSNTAPGKRLSCGEEFDKPGFLGTIGKRLVVTVSANLSGRNRGVIRDLHTHVTLGTWDLELGYVDLVFEGDRLMRFGRPLAARQD